MRWFISGCRSAPLTSLSHRRRHSWLFLFGLRSSLAFVCSSVAIAPTRVLSAMASTSTATSSSCAADSSLESMMENSAAYKELVGKLKEISHLENAVSVLSYDRMVFMPESAAVARGSQMSILAKIIHEKATDPQLEKLLEQANRDMNADKNDSKEIRDDAHILLRLAREEYDKKTRIPPALEAKRAELSSTAYAAWVKAKQENDFQLFAPYLKECFDVAQQTAVYLRGNDDDKKDRSLYTVLLNEYERGMPVQRIDEIFDTIEKALVPLLQKVLKAAAASQVDPNPLTSVAGFSLDIDRQKRLTEKIVMTLGYDTSRGRIDVSVHPFTSSVGGRHDVRITSRYNDREWYSGLAGAIHECGHAMYEQNLGNSNTVLDQYLSMGCHESQSLFWERHVGMSYPFACYLLPIVSDILGSKDNDDAATTPFTAMDIYRAVNQVQPGLIRVDADELTYPLHVLLRYRVERELLSEDDNGGNQASLTVDQVPNRWNQAMKDMLGVDVPSDAQGCLQDVHWASLAIGYFPTYLIGSSTAAQLAHYCRRDIPDFDRKVEAGEFDEIRQWLNDKVHRHGRRYPSLDALLQDQLGEPLNPQYFIDYLTEKYTSLYNCQDD